MLVYGVVVINAQFVDPLRSVWREVRACHLDSAHKYTTSTLQPRNMMPSMPISCHLALASVLRQPYDAGRGKLDSGRRHSGSSHSSVRSACAPHSGGGRGAWQHCCHLEGPGAEHFRVRSTGCTLLGLFNCPCVQAMCKLVSAFEAVSVSHSIKLLRLIVKTYGQLELTI